jgi:hypothetical protein
MSNLGGKIFIQKIRTRWIISGLMASLFIAFSIAILIVSIFNIFSSISHWNSLYLTSILVLILIKISKVLKINEDDVSRLLNQSYPQLEESSALILKDEESLNMLEKLQAKKVEKEIINLQVPIIIYKRLKTAVVLLILSLVGFSLIEKINIINFEANPLSIVGGKSAVADKILPEIASIRLKISPPSYTNNKTRTQRQFSAIFEDESLLEWTIETNQSVGNLEFIFNNTEKTKLRALNKDKTVWTFSRSINKSGFYQVKLDGQLSDLYKLEIIKDELALIRISSPKQYSTIDFGEPQRTNLQVQVNDDYGVNDVYISATVSSGQGEGVKFKEQSIRFDEKISGDKEYKLQKTINLASLGMQPGDELYFFIQAIDSRKQISRSDVYQVSIQDTAKLMSMNGMLGGVNLVPEYFRSQRQIIIDTEKLLKEKNSIGSDEFKNRSNNLGIDQKLLRLRYGKFLGEESEGEIGAGNEEHEDHEGHEDEESGANFGDAQKIMDSYAHKHDVAEDATFFEPELKSQLKATLAEMWKSELRLRTYKPEEALPFEYKALRLLKDLQQKSRAYVSKTALKTAPIKEEKRLSGELDKIIQPSAEKTFSKNEEQSSLKKASVIISKLKNGAVLRREDRAILQDASQKISAKAISEPAKYLTALKIMRKILGTTGSLKLNIQELAIVESALQGLINPEVKSPQTNPTRSKTSLSIEYFKRLKQVQP